MPEDPIQISIPPAIPGVQFRRFRGESDYPNILGVMSASTQADRIERAVTLEEIARNYQRLVNCDPSQDLVFAEVEGEAVGYARGWWWEEGEANRVYDILGFVVPRWRRHGIGRALQHWMEYRLRDVAAAHSNDRARFFEVSVSHFQEGLTAMLERDGYQPVRYFDEMVRPDLDDLPDLPLPGGVELHPVSPDHFPAIWTSIDETSRDEWGYTPSTEEGYKAWLESPHFQPDLWQVAWDPATGRVAGHVLAFIDHDENEKFNRKRGYTEGIGVDPGWRKRGLASALITRSLQRQKAAGMVESAMHVDRENTSGATRLYENLGFRIVRRDAIYRKAF